MTPCGLRIHLGLNWLIIAELWKTQLLNIRRWNSKPFTRCTFVPLILSFLNQFPFAVHIISLTRMQRSIKLWNTNHFHIGGATEGNSTKYFLLLLQSIIRTRVVAFVDQLLYSGLEQNMKCTGGCGCKNKTRLPILLDLSTENQNTKSRSNTTTGFSPTSMGLVLCFREQLTNPLIPPSIWRSQTMCVVLKICNRRNAMRKCVWICLSSLSLSFTSRKGSRVRI